MSLIDVSGDGDVKVAALEFNLAKTMAEDLHAAYPGHLWAVSVEGKQGIATVRNLALSGNWGFILRLANYSTASEWKKLTLRAGGEILERYRLQRGIADHAAIDSLPMNFSGNVIGDKSK